MGQGVYSQFKPAGVKGSVVGLQLVRSGFKTPLGEFGPIILSPQPKKLNWLVIRMKWRVGEPSIGWDKIGIDFFSLYPSDLGWALLSIYCLIISPHLCVGQLYVCYTCKTCFLCAYLYHVYLYHAF